MTKKHFEAIADTLHNLRQDNLTDTNTIDLVVDELGDVFSDLYDNYDHNRFRDAVRNGL